MSTKEVSAICSGAMVVEGYTIALFEEQAAAVAGVKGVSSADQLVLYGLFKQCKGGDVSSSRPGVFDAVKRAKWDAHAARKGVSKECAGMAYVAFVDSLAGTSKSTVVTAGASANSTTSATTTTDTATTSSSSSFSSSSSSSSSFVDDGHTTDGPTDSSSLPAPKASSIQGRVQQVLDGLAALPGYSPSRFKAAAVAIYAADNVTNETYLSLYGLYKQCSQGEVHKPQPGVFDVIGRAKWHAWKARAGLDRARAGQAYCMLVEDLCGHWPVSEQVQVQVQVPATKAAAEAIAGSGWRSPSSGGSSAVATPPRKVQLPTQGQRQALAKDDCPFDKEVHLTTRKPTGDDQTRIDELRAKIEASSVYQAHPVQCGKFCSDAMLMRFLVGKGFKMKQV